MQRAKYGIYIIVLSFFLLNGCVTIDEQEKYQHPSWLEGKLFTQIATLEDLSEFSKALEISGYDTILDISGSYTVFAPSNQAFEEFFSDNPEYGSSVSDIPVEDLVRIVKYHIIQDAWNKQQLQMLDIDGWVDPSDPDNEPRAYKRQTLLKDPNRKYWVESNNGKHVIVDSSGNANSKIVYTRSRKFVPIFYRGLFDIYNLIPDDYEFYFNRPFESDNLYYAGAKLQGEEIFAENGFVYIVDRVVKPFLNAEQLLEREIPGESYKIFSGLINLFPSFEFNSEATYNQPEAREGILYDSLYDLSYPELPFDVHQELTGSSIAVSDYTYVYHNALFIPTDVGFQKFLDEKVTDKSGFPHWPDFEEMPLEIKQIIINTHFALTPVYKSDLIAGFKNAENDIIRIDESIIIRKEYGSNCTFLGLSEAVVPRAFLSVAGPVYLRPAYKTFMYALEYSDIRSAITEEDAEYCFFALPDAILRVDSSLMLNWEDRDQNRYSFKAWDRGEEKITSISRRDLAKMLLNHVGLSMPDGSANKEFIENLAGNYLIWDNVRGTVCGSSKSTFGYRGDSTVVVQPMEFMEEVDNGIAFSVNSWLNPVRGDLASALFAYPKFMELLTKARMYDSKLYKFTALTDGEYYTVFAPTDNALINYGVDEMSVEELEEFLKYHFVKSHLIFTDGKKPWQDYETMRVDESSTEYSKRYSTINIRTSPDLIEILDAGGTPYISIPENENKTNVMAGKDTDATTLSDMDYITFAVVHEIDKVLVKQ